MILIIFLNGNLVVDSNWAWNNSSGYWNRNQDLVVTNIPIMSWVFSVSTVLSPIIGTLPLPLPPLFPLPPQLLVGGGRGHLGTYQLMGGGLGTGVRECVIYPIAWMMVSNVSAGIEILMGS